MRDDPDVGIFSGLNPPLLDESDEASVTIWPEKFGVEGPMFSVGFRRTSLAWHNSCHLALLPQANLLSSLAAGQAKLGLCSPI